MAHIGPPCRLILKTATGTTNPRCRQTSGSEADTLTLRDAEIRTSYFSVRVPTLKGCGTLGRYESQAIRDAVGRWDAGEEIHSGRCRNHPREK